MAHCSVPINIRARPDEQQGGDEVRQLSSERHGRLTNAQCDIQPGPSALNGPRLNIRPFSRLRAAIGNIYINREIPFPSLWPGAGDSGDNVGALFLTGRARPRQKRRRVSRGAPLSGTIQRPPRRPPAGDSAVIKRFKILFSAEKTDLARRRGPKKGRD